MYFYKMDFDQNKKMIIFCFSLVWKFSFNHFVFEKPKRKEWVFSKSNQAQKQEMAQVRFKKAPIIGPL